MICQPKVPGIHHIATGDREPERKLQFYSRIFDMREVEVNRGGVEAGKRSRGYVVGGEPLQGYYAPSRVSRFQAQRGLSD
jgi:catechol 2,3-dioxygenase-like lactoylglutathione lyase family enzyme